jgi:phosphonate transport system ATP-binding protein
VLFSALPPPVIEMRRVGVVYSNGVTALFPTSLTFERGLIHVILGSSGAGKSTLLRCLNGLVSPSTGEVLSSAHGPLRGGRLLREHRRRSAMIFQKDNLLPSLTVLRNVLHGRLGYHSIWRTILPASMEDRQLALETLAQVGLLDKALERVDQLSVGQQQRVGLARALAQKPEVLLADEPVASLDPATAQQALALIAEVCRQHGITAVVSLHQVELARAFADRVIGLMAGRVAFDGPPERITREALQRIYGTADASPSNSTHPDSGEISLCIPQYDSSPS